MGGVRGLLVDVGTPSLELCVSKASIVQGCSVEYIISLIPIWNDNIEILCRFCHVCPSPGKESFLVRVCSCFLSSPQFSKTLAFPSRRHFLHHSLWTHLNRAPGDRLFLGPSRLFCHLSLPVMCVAGPRVVLSLEQS